MNHILVDWKKEGEFFIEKEFAKMGVDCKLHVIQNYSMKDRIKAYRIIFLYFKYLQFTYRAIVNSKDNDVLICWNFTTSIACGYLCKILHKKRIVLGLNIIARERNLISETIRRLIFSPLMNSDNYYITINSSIYIDDYCRRFKVNKDKFFVLNDPISTSEINDFNYKESYIFVGGEVERDWETLFKACEEIPQIKFVCIARKKYFNQSLKIPGNVELHFDTDHDTFFNFMRNSSIVLIPLKSQLPTGLIVLLESALMQKPVIATNTPSIANYIENGKRGLLIEQGNPKDILDKINILYNNIELQKSVTTNLLSYVLTNHSHESYSKILLEIIEKISVQKSNKNLK